MSDKYAKAVKDGFITKRQSEKLNKPYLDYLIKRNKAKNHKPKRVDDKKWAEYKAKRSQAMSKAPANPSPKPTKSSAKKTTTTSATAKSADSGAQAPRRNPRRSTRKK